MSALVTLKGCTDDRGSPAAELRSIDRSSAVRDRLLLGDAADDRGEPDASQPSSAARHGPHWIACTVRLSRATAPLTAIPFLAPQMHAEVSRGARRVAHPTSPSAPPWRKDTKRFLSDSCESCDGTGTTLAVGASHADGGAGAWLPDLSGDVLLCMSCRVW